jgi:hypothetical protein
MRTVERMRITQLAAALPNLPRAAPQVWLQQKGGPANLSGQIEQGDMLLGIQNLDHNGNVLEERAKLAGVDGTAVQLTFK